MAADPTLTRIALTTVQGAHTSSVGMMIGRLAHGNSSHQLVLQQVSRSLQGEGEGKGV